MFSAHFYLACPLLFITFDNILDKNKIKSPDIFKKSGQKPSFKTKVGSWKRLVSGHLQVFCPLAHPIS